MFTPQPVTGAVRHERELAGLQFVVFAAFYFHQAPTRRHDVEHQTVFECRQRQRPGRRIPPAYKTPVIRKKCRASR